MHIINRGLLVAHRQNDLAGYVLIEIDSWPGFLSASEMNSVSVQVCGKKKRIVGLIVPGCYRARAKKPENFRRFRERYPYFELELEPDAVSKPFMIKQAAQKIADYSCISHCSFLSLPFEKAFNG